MAPLFDAIGLSGYLGSIAPPAPQPDPQQQYIAQMNALAQRDCGGSLFGVGIPASLPPKPIKDRVRSMSGVDLDEVEASIAWCRSFDACWAD